MTTLVAYVLLFAAVGIGFILVHLLVGKLIRPAKPDAEKLAIYECGEPTIGSSWVQFDLRFYVIALLFVIFDVEVAFFFPWAVVFGKTNALGDPRVEGADRQQLTQGLVPGAAAGTEVAPEAAVNLAWVAFIDIVIFFGLLLVGFAYLWRRGDLNWVRSTAAERAEQELMPQPPPLSERPELIGAGREV